MKHNILIKICLLVMSCIIANVHAKGVDVFATFADFNNKDNASAGSGIVIANNTNSVIKINGLHISYFEAGDDASTCSSPKYNQFHVGNLSQLDSVYALANILPNDSTEIGGNYLYNFMVDSLGILAMGDAGSEVDPTLINCITLNVFNNGGDINSGVVPIASQAKIIITCDNSALVCKAVTPATLDLNLK